MRHSLRGWLWFAIAVLVGGAGLVIAQQAETPPAAEPAPPAVEAAPPAAEAAPPNDSDIPSIEANRKNSVEANEDSLGRGKTLYTDRCLMCHGKSGNGKGTLALQLGYKVPDFSRAKALGNRTDGELYYLITRGHEAMPGEQDFISDKEKWDLVNYLRTFTPKG